MSQSIALDERTATMQLVLKESDLALRALKGAIRKRYPYADVRQLTEGKRLIALGTPGPIIKYEIIGHYGHPRVIIYHNGAEERTGELIDSFSRNYLKMPTWVHDN